MELAGRYRGIDVRPVTFEMHSQMYEARPDQTLLLFFQLAFHDPVRRDAAPERLEPSGQDSVSLTRSVPVDLAGRFRSKVESCLSSSHASFHLSELPELAVVLICIMICGRLCS